MREYKSFYKTVSGNEGEKCYYPTRLDTYGCGCAHNCKYCYARSLLEFRGFWNPQQPSVADIKKIEKKVSSLKPGTVLRLGGMTDCFQPCEKVFRNTYKTIKLLNQYGIHYLIVTKSDLVADDDYISIMDKRLAHIQITVTSTDDTVASGYEKATPPSKRIRAIEKLERNGFDVQIRLSPFIPEFLDFDILNQIRCKKAIVEFLRANEFIKKTFREIDYKKYTHKENGYYHLALETKINLLKKLTGFDEISVCEDCTDAYIYWKDHFNYNKNDCCNLKLTDSAASRKSFKYIGNSDLMKEHKTAFLCSSNASTDVRRTSIKWAEKQCVDKNCIISGFQSEAEKDVLDVILAEKGLGIIVLPHSIYEKCPSKLQNAVNEGRLLIISFFEDGIYRINRLNAEKRNHQVLECADTVVIGYAKKDGMIAQLINNSSKNVKILCE